MSRTTVFLSALSAAIITLALLSTAAGGSHTTTAALVLLPVVLFLGIATHIRVVQINTEEIEVMLAMNRLRHAYLEIAPGLEPYFTTGHHDDAPGLAASFLLPRNPGRLGPWGYFLASTPTVIATVDAALAAAVVALAVRQAGAPAAIAVVTAAAAFLLVWAALVSWERHTLDPVARTTPRFPHRQTTPEQRFVVWRQSCARITVRPRRCVPCSMTSKSGSRSGWSRSILSRSSR